MIAMLILWMGLIDARAEDDPLSSVASRIHDIVRSPRPDAGALNRAVTALRVRVEALSQPVPEGLWVDVLLDLTLARYQLGRDWKAPRTAAFLARPDRAMPVGPSLTVLREWRPDLSPERTELPWGRTVWLDGQRRDTLPPLEGLHLVQGTRCGDWRSDLVEGPATDAVVTRWTAPCPTPGWRPSDTGLVAAGTTLAVLGVVATTASWILSRQVDLEGEPMLSGRPLSRGDRSALRAANATGWVAMGLGVSLVLPGSIRRGTQIRRGRARP